MGETLEGKQKLPTPESEQIPVVVIDETDPENILSDTKRTINLESVFGGIPYSTEGFAENPERQMELARYLIKKLALKTRGPILDVGYGSNIHITNTFAQMEIQSFALDLPKEGDTLWISPRIRRTAEESAVIVEGDVANLNDKGSALKDQKFGLILFNGSWTSGGNNWTVGGEILESKYHDQQRVATTKTEFMHEEKDKILRVCRDSLRPAGIIGIVSSRYAFHGAGYEFEDLPEEKLSFLDVYERLQRMGAKKIYIVGVTQEGFDRILEASQKAYETLREEKRKFSLVLPVDKISEIRRRLKAIADLPPEDIMTRYGDNKEFQMARNNTIIERLKGVPELNKTARIDALFAEF